MTSQPLYDFQRDGVIRLTGAVSGNQLLAFEPGLGKTITSIASADINQASSILVLCQAVGKTHWRKEFQRWQTIKRSISTMHGFSQSAAYTDVVIANYDLISRTDSIAYKSLLRRSWDALIIDEGHALKTRTSKRTKAVYGKRCDQVGGLAEKAAHVWVLSGTPAPNHAGELYPHLRALAPETIIGANSYPMTEDQFIEAFCTYRTTTFGRQITGSKNMDQLRKRIDHFIFRKRKTDVLPDLPPLAFDTLHINPNDVDVPPTLLRELAAADKALAGDFAFLNAMQDGDRDTGVLALIRGMNMDNHLATQRRLAGRVKAVAAIDLVKQELAWNTSKVILFAHHHEVIDQLVSELAKDFGVVKLDGRDSPTLKDAAVHRFQNEEGVRVFVGQTQAAGTSITLHAASNVIFVEADWVPSNNVQAACRAHRIGQKDGVLARFLTLEGSVDQHIMAAVARKSRELAQLIDNEVAL